jgi:hypothetical protein
MSRLSGSLLKKSVNAAILSFLLLPVLMLLTLAGCGSGSTTSPTSADYTLSATPATVSLAPGGSATMSVLASAAGSFTGTVSVAVSGLPAGVTANPSALTLTPGTTQTITLKAASTTVAGSATVTLTGTAGTLVHTAATTLTVTAPVPVPDFSLTIAPAKINVLAGSTISQPVTVSVAPINGFSGSVSVNITGLPAGVTASPNTVTLKPGTPQIIQLLAASSATASSSTLTFTGTSGALSHTATLALSVAVAQPDFSLAVNPTTQSVTINGATGSTVTVSATAINGFSSPVAVALTGLPAGVTATPSTLTLLPGQPQNISLAATSTATAGPSTLLFTGTAGTIVHTATLALTVATAPVPDVTTYHYDNTRQGQNTQETILNPANVNATTFGKTGFYTTDGGVDAQPLFAANVPINATTTENLVYVATEHDTVYAFSSATGQPVWSTSILGAGESPSDSHGCNQISPEIGITATPVIDRAQGPHGTIFVVGMSLDGGGAYHQRLHALDLATGAEVAGSPTEIAATYPGAGETAVNGMVSFAPGQYAERAGLLLVNGTIYMSWTSHCDQQPYQGWVMGYNEASLQQTSVINVTPNGGEGSIWMSGYGLAADTSGNIYFLDANGSFSGSVTSTGFPLDLDYGNAILKLSTTGGTLAVADFFQPYNTMSESMNDVDLGSGGGMLLPDLADAAGNIHHLLVGAGKDSNIYVANRDSLGRFNSANNANIYQELPGALPNGAWSGSAYFNNTVYYAGVSDTLRAFPISNAMLATSPSSVSATAFAYPGTTPTVSANGATSGIVWAIDSSQGVLHAYDATNLANELYNSSQAANSRDSFGPGSKFITPMEVNGAVYIGTPSGVAVFGLLPSSN